MKEIYKDIDIVIFDVMGVIVRKQFLGKLAIDKDLYEYLSFLKGAGINRGILSNMPREWWRYFSEKFSLVEYFNPIVLSGEVGMRKPDKEIYLEFEKRSGIPLERSLFIDDRLSNLEAASNLGIKTVYFKKGDGKGYGNGFNPDFQVNSFTELF
jgi:HAD superfamily hydrolase (TIGR01509 family)